MVQKILGAMQTPDGYWRVEVFRERGQQWYRVLHGTTVVDAKTVIGTVQRILGDQYAALESAA